VANSPQAEPTNYMGELPGKGSAKIGVKISFKSFKGVGVTALC
jgi:hypothetical protein